MSDGEALPWHAFDRGEDLAEALAARTAQWLRAALAARAQACLVVSGGRTPAGLLTALSRHKLPWGRLVVTLADERWVPGDHPDSNEGLVRRTLLSGDAAAARFVGFYDGSAAPEAAAQGLDRRLRTLPRPFDVVLLGMGEDGHTASLFPGSEGLDDALDPRSERLCQAVRPPQGGHARITLTVAALLASRQLVLAIAGARKRDVLAKALAAGPPAELPVRALLRQEVAPLEIFWAP